MGKRLESNKVFLYIVFLFRVTFCSRSEKAQPRAVTPHLGMVFHPDDSMLMAIPTCAAQTRPLLTGPVTCCCFRAISGVGGPRPRLDQPLPHCLPSPFRALRARLKGRAARVAPQGADKRTADDPGAEIFRMWDFGEPGHSALGNLCLLRQVSRASTEGDVATVGDLAMFGVKVKQSQTRRSTLWRCTVGWTRPVCVGTWDLSACIHPASAFLLTR